MSPVDRGAPQITYASRNLCDSKNNVLDFKLSVTNCGLGLEAQRDAVSRYLNGGRWKLVAEYVEVESGKRNNRPQLQAAISHVKATRAKLVIARLDRLARNLHFVSSLQERGVDFVAADMPDANRLTIHIIAADAEAVGRTISGNTNSALAAAKARGVKLGKKFPRPQ
jgi:DNA invertase Pin-like site-specific DNA recombinase